jgi:ribosomal RNA-processing protein 9
LKDFVFAEDMIIRKKGHQLSTTCTVISPDEKFVFSSSKDCTIIKCSFFPSFLLILQGELETGKKLHQFHGHKFKETDGHTDQVYALAISSDGKFLASAGLDKLIKIWDPTKDTFVDALQGHRGPITVSAF